MKIDYSWLSALSNIKRTTINYDNRHVNVCIGVISGPAMRFKSGGANIQRLPEGPPWLGPSGKFLNLWGS